MGPPQTTSKRAAPPDADSPVVAAVRKKVKKKKKNLPDIPLSAHYHVSWMHRATITCVAVSLKHGYVISGDSVGICKFWKRGKVELPKENSHTSTAAQQRTDKRSRGCLEFVKAYTAHNSTVRCIVVDTTGDACVSVSLDSNNSCRLKFYEVSTFDAVSMLQIPINENNNDKNNDNYCCCVWFQTQLDSSMQSYLAVSLGTTIAIVAPSAGVVHQRLNLHAAPVTAMAYVPGHHCVVSADRAGTLDVWDCRGERVVDATTRKTSSTASVNDDEDDDTTAMTTTSTIHVGGPLTRAAHGITYDSKMETDLYVLQRKNVWAVAVCATATDSTSAATITTTYAVYATDHKVRVFDHATGSCLVTFHEGLKAYETMYTNFGLDAMAFGKRSATDREIQQNSGVFQDHRQQRFQLQFDPSGRYLLIPTMMGIKVLDWKQRKMIGMTGKLDADSLRFLGCCLASGDAVLDHQILLARGESGAARSEEKEQKNMITDALLIGVAYNQRRLYVFSHIDPVERDGPDAIGSRDVWNEAPTATDQRYTVDAAISEVNKHASRAILRTTMGDIHIQLFHQVPKTIENFVGHSRSGYYDNVIFHRIISGFMLQTGDPLGDGTGGESIWGGDFEDEIVAGLRHDRPFTVSMANAGKNTNGSQFFITTAPTPWLDGKHTVFGRVVRGMDICTQIEKVKTDKNDKPLEEIRIQNIDLE